MAVASGAGSGSDGAGGRLPYRSGMIVLAMGLGALLCGFLVQGSLHLDGNATLQLPRAVQRILARGGFSLSADGEVANPQLLLIGLGVTLLLVGAAQILNDRMHHETKRAVSPPNTDRG